MASLDVLMELVVRLAGAVANASVGEERSPLASEVDVTELAGSSCPVCVLSSVAVATGTRITERLGVIMPEFEKPETSMVEGVDTAEVCTTAMSVIASSEPISVDIATVDRRDPDLLMGAESAGRDPVATKESIADAKSVVEASSSKPVE